VSTWWRGEGGGGLYSEGAVPSRVCGVVGRRKTEWGLAHFGQTARPGPAASQWNDRWGCAAQGPHVSERPWTFGSPGLLRGAGGACAWTEMD